MLTETPGATTAWQQAGQQSATAWQQPPLDHTSATPSLPAPSTAAACWGVSGCAACRRRPLGRRLSCWPAPAAPHNRRRCSGGHLSRTPPAWTSRPGSSAAPGGRAGWKEAWAAPILEGSVGSTETLNPKKKHQPLLWHAATEHPDIARRSGAHLMGLCLKQLLPTATL